MWIKVKTGIHYVITLKNIAAGGENSIALAPGENSHLIPENNQGMRLPGPEVLPA